MRRAPAGPSRPDADPRLDEIARRLFWWKDPGEALADQGRFLAQAMTFATLEDMSYLRSVFDDEQLVDALTHAPAGVFDRRSWTFWHVKLGLKPVPPLPTRRLE